MEKADKKENYHRSMQNCSCDQMLGVGTEACKKRIYLVREVERDFSEEVMVKVTSEDEKEFPGKAGRVGDIQAQKGVCAKALIWWEPSTSCVAGMQRSGEHGLRGLWTVGRGQTVELSPYAKNNRKPPKDFKQEGDLIRSTLCKELCGSFVKNGWKQKVGLGRQWWSGWETKP